MTSPDSGDEERKRRAVAPLRPYPAYRSSGAEWLGEVPEHWNVGRLKLSLANIVEEAGGEASRSPAIALEDVESWTGRVRAEVANESSFSSRLRRFRDGDVLFGKLRPYLAKVTRLDTGGLCVGEFLVLRPCRPGVLGSYFEILLRSKPLIDVVSASTFGAKMPRTDWGALGAMLVACPPILEQAAIVRFVKAATRCIRDRIRAKEKLIGLLEEYKRSLIANAVVGRIDVRTGKPYQTYKDSGAEWLGDVPEHWDLRAAKRHFTEVNERSQSGREQLLSVSHISGVTRRMANRNTTDADIQARIGYKRCEPGDLIVNTMLAWKGALGIAKSSGLVSPSYAVYRIHSSSPLDSVYVGFLLSTTAYTSEFTRHSTGIVSSRLRLYPDDLLRIQILCPPAREQNMIARFLDDAYQRLSNFQKVLERQIALLREYQTRLISDVITGKLDVREAAAALPDADPLAGGTVHTNAPEPLTEAQTADPCQPT